MPNSCDNEPFAVSERVYRRLLYLYPVEYRREYREPMAQLFRDQCRDAWADARGWGLAALWLRVSLELVRTAASEHLDNLQRRKSMLHRTLMLIRGQTTPRTTFLALFGTVFVLALLSSALLAFLAPEQYSSTARMKLGKDFGNYDPYFVQAQFELIQSDQILSRVAKKLRLSESSNGLTAGRPRTETEAIKFLKDRLELRPVRNTGLIEIRAYSTVASEASELANALAETYREFSAEQANKGAANVAASRRGVEMVDRAVPGTRPVRPNKPFTLFLGLFGGGFLAALIAGVGALLVMRSRHSIRPPVAA